MSSSVSALVLAKLIGPRIRHGKKEEAQPHNVPFLILGAALLWFGWSGFNGGSALAADSVAALALINTYQAAGSSLIAWTLLERWRYHRWSSVGAVTGAIVGLVAITPSAGYVTPISACLIGLISVVLVYPSFQVNYGIDDSLDAFPCHGVSGFVGTVLTGFFAKQGGLFYGGGFHLVGVQLLAALAVAIFAASMSMLIYGAMRLCMRIRVSAEDELDGLDEVLHRQLAYTPVKPYGPPGARIDVEADPGGAASSGDEDDLSESTESSGLADDGLIVDHKHTSLSLRVLSAQTV